MAQVFNSIEEKVQYALEQSEQALLAAAQKGGEAEVSKAEFARYRIEFAFLLNERLNVNQVPVNLGDLLERLDILEQDVSNAGMGQAPPEIAEIMQRVQDLEDAPPPTSVAANGPVPAPLADRSALVRRLQALEDDVFSAAAERSTLDHRITQVEAPVIARVRAAAAAKAVAAKAAAAPRAPLTGSFGTPAQAGRNFTVQFDVSEPLVTGYARMRDDGFDVVGGSVIGARRVGGRSDRWQLLIRPSSPSDTITITATTAMRDSAGRALSTVATAPIR